MGKVYLRKYISFVLLFCMLVQIFIPSAVRAEESAYNDNQIYQIQNDVDTQEINFDDLMCMHGKKQGEECVDCGRLVHSTKNIPLVGCAEEFFVSVTPPADVDEEDLLLYNMKNIRLVCEHIVADGLYCEQCGGIVDIQPDDFIDCAIFDSCIHDKITGEKCEECKELKIEQGNYELTKGETWEDPLIYPTEILVDGTFSLRITDDAVYKYHCPWCTYEFGGTNWWLNVHYHGRYNGESCWARPSSQIKLTGTCKNHSSKVIYADGHVDDKWFSHEYWTPIHNYINIGEETEKVSASCKQSGKVITTEKMRCSICGNIKSGNSRSDIISQLKHDYTSYVYYNTNQHTANCKGIGTSAQQGHRYFCSQ